ncbi:MAG: cache domain-containing protein [Alphaproteobacteria bacterium]|nr:cache domain-containing protein [Alphaproteobacteria bacterium]
MNLIKNLINYSLIIIFSLFISKSLFAEEFGTKEEAAALLDRAISLVKVDKNRALDLFTTGSGGLHVKDLYPFCMTDKGLLLGHPTLEGGNVLNFEDSEGKAVGRSMIAVAKYGEVNEVDLMIARLTTDDEKLYKKTQLVTRVADLICAVGFYSE